MTSTMSGGLRSEKEVVDFEKKTIGKDRGSRLGKADPNVWCGIGLSGGGIRSASFALGVLQAFAMRDLLKHFDYMSTVSGGGYLGSALQWWWSKSPREEGSKRAAAVFGLGPDDFPYGPPRPTFRPTPEHDDTTQPPDPTAQGIRNLAFLRAHASYLAPGGGLNLWSMFGVLLRTVVISLLIWIPLLTLFFSIIAIVDDRIILQFKDLYGWMRPLGSTLFGSPEPYRWLVKCNHDFICELTYPATYALLLMCFYFVVLLFLCGAPVFALLSRAPQQSGPVRMVARFLLGVLLPGYCIWRLFRYFSSPDLTVYLLAAGLGVFALVTLIVLVADSLTTRQLNASYILRRSLEKAIGLAFVPALAILAIALVPLFPQFVAAKISSGTETGGAISGSVVGGLIGILGGVGSALYSYYTFIRSVVPGLATRIAMTCGAAIYLYATLVLGYFLSRLLLFVRDLNTAFASEIFFALIGSILIALAIGAIANINYVGLHRFYRDRLMEAFMPTDTSVFRMCSTFSPVADSLNMSDLTSSLEAGPGFTPRPYPLINTNVILIGDDDKRIAVRGGENFMISPLFIGSTATGWRNTDEYIDSNGPLTLATAMAASGAAATANAGYIGTGVTMNPVVAAAMAFLNIRLGLWIGNPNRLRRRISLKTIPTFLKPGLYSGIFAHSRSRSSHFLELTDGGHFENLGLYELVRRKLGVIVIVDGEEDAKISLSSLVSAARRIEQDFGARLDFIGGKGPEGLMMYPEKGYPAGLRYAESPYVVGKLTYDDGSIGVLVYIKATLIKGMDFLTAGYLAGNPEFPHQSTMDQFFDPEQFDAYRLLGFESGTSVITALKLDENIRKPEVLTLSEAKSHLLNTEPRGSAAFPE